MKAKVKQLIMLIIASLVTVFTVGYAFAWFLDRKDSSFIISGASAGAYFDYTSGDGTSAEFIEGTDKGPFVISNAIHMRNLAVLQNTGRFGNNKYYFKIKDTVTVLDMGSLWLPPIGTDDNPFIGEFDGNGKSIKNLKVTTDKALLTELMYPTQASAGYKFSQSVGFFGNTGKDSVIRNFILNNPHVVVGKDGVNNNKYTESSVKVVGIAVGHVGGKCQSIGVRATDAGENTADGVGSTTLDVRVIGYSTFNSILGELGEGIESSVTGGGHVAGSGTGGSGNAFGANIDINGIVDRLILIHDNNEASWRLPRLGDYYLNTAQAGSKGTTLASQEKMAFTVGADSTYEGATAYETLATNNIGYVLGNQTKFYSKTYTFGEPMALSGNTYQHTDGVIPKWIYRRTGTYGANYSTSSIVALTQSEMDALPQNLKDSIFPAEGQSSMALDSIAISQTYNNVGAQIYPGSTSNGQWSPHGQISWNGNTYGEGFRGDENTTGDSNGICDAVDENGYRYTADGNKLDENGFLFDNDGYYIAAEDFYDIIYSVDENGHGKDENGEYYFKYKKHWDDNDYIFGKLDANGYFYNDDGYIAKDFDLPILSVGLVDGVLYAKNSDGLYYDTSGFTIDENGFVLNDNGYYFPDLSAATYPVNQCEIDEDGYLVYGQYSSQPGERYTDDKGKQINAYDNYGLGTDDGVNYYLTLNGEKFTFVQYNQNWELPAKKGTKVKILTGEELVSSMNGKYVVAKTGTAIAYHYFLNGVSLPNNGIWFKPSIAGTIRILLFAEDTGKGITLVQGHRPSATRQNPFIVEYNASGGDMTAKEVAKCDLPAHVLCYFEYNITEEEIADGRYEYWIIKNDSGGGAGANFVYLDLGASAPDEDTSGIVPDKVSAVDFIYDGVEIEQEDTTIGIGNFIVNVSGEKALYDSSKTSVYFDGITKILKVVYVRLHNEEREKHSGKTICLEYSDPALNTESEVKATYAVYVCPTISGGSGTVGGGGQVNPNPGPDNPDAPTLTVTNTSLSMTVGGATQKINATASSGATITYSSNKPDIASVASDGTVTANAAGTATITVTATADGKTTTKTVNVTVTAAQITDTAGTYTYSISDYKSSVSGKATDSSISVTGLSGSVTEGNVSENPNDYKFTPGYTVTITLNAQAGQNVSVKLTGYSGSTGNDVGISVDMTNATRNSSSNEIVFSADTSNSNRGEGTVQYTATSDGEIVITLTRSKNNTTRVTDIEVVIGGTPEGGDDPAPTPTVTGVELNKTSMTLTSAGATEQLTATVKPNNASNQNVTWSSNNESVATVDQSGNVTAVANGTATITVTTADGNKTATCTVTVDIPETPTPSGNKEATATIVKFAANDTLIDLKDDGNNNIAKVVTNVEASGNVNSDASYTDENGNELTKQSRVEIILDLKLNLNENYTYKIIIIAASNGSSGRTVNLSSGDTVISSGNIAGSNSSYSIVELNVTPTSGNTEFTIDSGNNKVRLSKVVVIATPKT